MNLKILFRPYIYASIIAAVDFYIKYTIRTNNIQENIIIENFLTIDLTYNTGIAFGLFSEYTLVTYFFSIIVFSWLIFQFRNVEQNTLEFYSLVLILG